MGSWTKYQTFFGLRIWNVYQMFNEEKLDCWLAEKW
jgi:hypothetical protein